jgi:quinoprotein glucose dehydrogenase
VIPLLLLVHGLAQDPSAEREAARKALVAAPGFKVTLWAAEPLVQNPVALDVDPRGRVWVAEDFRRHGSLPDVHHRLEWLDDDLACRRHEDLVAYQRRRLGADAEKWRIESERIRIVEDRGGTGTADHASVFSEGYRELGEGIGAGVLVRGVDVYYACIPNLWRLTDADGDGKEDSRRALHTGFGVRLGASGHDMHGLRFGPDGKLYWSHGDRGFRVEADGLVHDYADTGGVLRCNPDGSELEIVCSGLRNPQELVFNELGDLFTGDNNISKAPDTGETCRWTHVVEGADFGWRIGYQFMPDGGAWCAEDLWRLEAAFQVPCVARLGHGPSGVTAYPGTGFSPRWDGHVFMCDYPGGIYSFRLDPRGASYGMSGLGKFLWGLNAPDLEFGPDGALYVADWVGRWDPTGKGRIWRVEDPEGSKDPEVARVRRLIGEGMSRRSLEELSGLLEHRDRRVRQEAQFELAARRASDTLAAASAPVRPRLARLHALWGLGQVFHAGQAGAALRPVAAALDDADAEVRAQAWRVLGDRRVRMPEARAMAGLADPEPRVRYFAALGVARSGHRGALPGVVRLLRENGGSDRVLQHAGIQALAEAGDPAFLAALAKDASVVLRRCALVACRKLRRPELAGFLHDADPSLVLEAARAIYDVPVEAAFPALAALLDVPAAPERALLRSVNVARRLGDSGRLADAAADPRLPAAVRIEALEVLADGDRPSGRDRLMGVWRPVAPWTPAEAVPAAERAALAILKEDAPEAVLEAALRGARRLKVEQVIGLLWGLVEEEGRAVPVRVEALRGLAALGDARVPDLALRLLESPDARLAVEAAGLLPSLPAPDAAGRLEKVALGSAPTAARQAAIGALGRMKDAAADDALGRMMDRLLAGNWPAPLMLDLLEAAARREALKTRLAEFEAGRPEEDALAPWRETLEGGDAAAGRRLAFERNDLQCIRCHRVKGEGGEVGPELGMIGAQRSPELLLESIVLPNRQISPGYGQTAFLTASGEVEVGRVEGETDAEVRLLLPDGARKVLAKDRIRTRKEALSAMPEDLVKRLGKRELRDLLAWLQSLR